MKLQKKKQIRLFLVKKLTRLTFWLKNKDKEPDSSVISLAPKVLIKEEDIKVIQPYLDELERSLAEKELTNIAITGAYGSGKSTIIKTFKHLHDEYEYLNISLASFKDNDENGKKKSPEEKEQGVDENGKKTPLEQTVEKDDESRKQEVFNTSLERRLEISILQQIFYHVRPSEIPDSRFKRIVNNKRWKLFLISFGLIVWLISVFVLFRFDYLDKLNPSTWDFSLKFDWIAFTSFFIFFTGVGFFTKYLVRLFSNSKINKFSIKGELELGDNVDKSVFNEHLEEIIYFFERTPYNVVIIEDLDRFDTTDIFTKLRELNILLNTSKLIKREINFIYAIKDELFTDKNERVKFFDYIIPIIPFINASNAGVKLDELIKTRQLENVLTSDFIQDIVSFIDDIDMRLLINIFHEFCIYRENIPAENQDNLFAMIVYKNMYPDDFGKLSKHDGLLYKFISDKDKYISGLLNLYSEKIKQIESEIINVDKEKITSVQELRTIFLFKLQTKIPGITEIYIENQRIAIAQFLEDEYFVKLLEDKDSNIIYYRNGNGVYNSSITFSSIIDGVKPTSYEQRENLILAKNNNHITQLKEEITKLKNKKREIELKSLQEIFQEIEIEPYLGIFSNNQMMRTLLINGYLNEDYEDYISLFHEGNITRADETFKRKIKSGKNSPFDYQLSDKVGNLIKEIPDKYFKREIILNFDLLDFLSTNFTQYQSKYNDIISILSNENNNSVEFVEKYIERGKNLSLFIKSLCKSWNNWWYYIYEVESPFAYDDKKLKKYLKLIIELADEEIVLLMNKDNKLSEFISILPDFISLIDKSYETKTKNLLKRLDIKFKQLDSPNDTTRSLFDYIYENNFYEINDENISMILLLFNKDIDKRTLIESNYSTILNSGCKDLIDYIEDNISTYINNILLKLEDNTKETEENIVKLINNDNLSISAKTNIVLKQEILISDISEIQDISIQKMLIDKNKIIATWSNLYLYYETLEEGSDLDDVLINYLNQKDNSNLLSEQAIKDELKGRSEETIKSFSLKIINCNDLQYENYISILKSTPYVWNSLNFEDLDEEKIKWMVDTSFLTLTVYNFNKLKEHFPKEHIKLVEKQQSKLLPIFDELGLSGDDILSLLKSETITNSNKIGIIEKIDDSFVTENKDIAKLTCDILALSNNSVPLNFDIIKSLLNSSSSKENKIQLLNKQVEELTDSQLQSLTEQLGWNYQKLFKKQNKPTFTDTKYNRLLFDNLIKRGLIIRYEEHKKDELKVFANY
ncbi:hypothetical protein [Parabacteroides sp. PF5-9]|uniref:YobI family P-loop NTPase n=1 Tax=Parabacteroides sp. PF5-9 TaxID=1742404 RepID=UPI002474AD37|nr:hypothetical protein [Parabacteroides sp. PF5-9]MDH6357345.1 energy-coupling factor transporter ATP-binding protein EcfA2 [Parabacteroides sp. PF5-9]